MNGSGGFSLPMIELLAGHREMLNQIFHKRKGSGAKVDIELWSDHLRNVIAPIVDAVYSIAEERARTTLLDLYDVSLDLFAAGHFSESGSSLLLHRLWREVFPSIAGNLSRSPRRISGSLSNALLALTMESPVIAKRWLEELKRVGLDCENTPQLLDAGKVLAWTAGMAVYRGPALAIIQHLNIHLLRSLFQIADTVPEKYIRQWFAELESNPWAKLQVDQTAHICKIAEVYRCGAFRGFGGLFLEPPRLFLHLGQIYVREHHGIYRLIVDQFGSFFQRMGNFEPEKTTDRPAAVVDSRGIIRWEGCETFQCPWMSTSSQAFDGRTLAITLPDSFHIYLFAKQSP